MAAKKRTPTTTSQTKEEVGFRAEHTKGQKRNAQTHVDANGKKIYVAPTIPDPGITHGPFRVFQRADGPWIVIDERRAPGDRTVAIFEGRKGKNGEPPPITPKQEAELRAIALSKEVEGPNADRIHEGGAAQDLDAPRDAAPTGT